MSQSLPAADSSPALPPIILLVEDDSDTRDMYSVYFESQGMWVAGATNPGEAIQAVDELKPDLIVTDLGFHGRPLGLEFIDLLKGQEATATVPVVLLSGHAPSAVQSGTHAQPDVWLVKPVLPADLAAQVNLLLDKSQAIRARNTAALRKASELRQRSNAIIAKGHGIVNRVNLTARSCPDCSQTLQFIESGSIDGRQYDYYHWCANRCGLYCFDRDARRWLKLAG